MVQLGNEDIFYVFLLPPAQVKELVAFYLDERNQNALVKARIEKTVTAWAGSVNAFKNLDWCVVVITIGSGPDLVMYPSFREYLVHKAHASDSDLYRDDPEMKYFSYTCR